MLDGKAKGSRFERYLSKLHTEITGIPFDRTFRSGGGTQKGDIAPVQGNYFPFCIEAKHRENVWTIDNLIDKKGPLWDWWYKIKDEAKSIGVTPLLIAKRNRKPTLVMSTEQIIDILGMSEGVDNIFITKDKQKTEVIVITEDDYIKYLRKTYENR